MEVKIKRLNKDAVIPTQANPGDAGIDLTATELSISVAGVYSYGTGISVEIPEGHVGLLFPRSSIYKNNMELVNSVGVIDSGYRGEIIFNFRKVFHETSTRYSIGDRIGQLVIVPIPSVTITEVDELSSTQRNAGGFGSTGN